MDKNNLEQLRHSCSHLLAAAVMELWPSVKIAIGPAIENGFYYDFDFGETKVSENDFSRIEQKMHQIVKNWGGFKKIEVSKKEALAFLKSYQWSSYIDYLEIFRSENKIINRIDFLNYFKTRRDLRKEIFDWIKIKEEE